MPILKALLTCIVAGFIIAIFIISGALVLFNYELLIVMSFLSIVVFGLAYSLYTTIQFIYEKVTKKC